VEDLGCLVICLVRSESWKLYLELATDYGDDGQLSRND